MAAKKVVLSEDRHPTSNEPREREVMLRAYGETIIIVLEGDGDVVLREIGFKENSHLRINAFIFRALLAEGDDWLKSIDEWSALQGYEPLATLEAQSEEIPL